MQAILRYIKEYIQGINWRILVPALFFMSLGIFINYYFHLQNRIRTYNPGWQLVSWYFIFLSTLVLGYGLQAYYKNSGIFNKKPFIVLMLLAPALFAWKMVGSTYIPLSQNQLLDAYWNQVIYWPLKLVVITFLLIIIWKIFNKEQPFYGFSTKQFHARTYWIMLLVMVPLIAAASTQPDFLFTYPKLKNISFLNDHNSWYYTLLFELSYGSDFFTIELFFRGFLVLAFARWVGKDAILPMALFYCTIHFGKPLGECISSFFGGMLLGIVTYHTKSIWGGLMVHLGIAWLMELGGYLGNQYFYS